MSYGIITAQQKVLKDSLADCYWFRRWQGNNWSRQQALDRIYHEGLPGYDHNLGDGWAVGTLMQMRPFCYIYTDEDGGFTGKRVSADGWAWSGQLIARFEQDLPSQYAHDQEQADYLFKRDIERMVYSSVEDQPGLIQLANMGSDITGTIIYRDMNDIRFAGPYRTDPDQRVALGDAQAYYLVIEWGSER